MASNYKQQITQKHKKIADKKPDGSARTGYRHDFM